jgi:hypothetical protein
MQRLDSNRDLPAFPTYITADVECNSKQKEHQHLYGRFPPTGLDDL